MQEEYFSLVFGIFGKEISEEVQRYTFQ